MVFLISLPLIKGIYKICSSTDKQIQMNFLTLKKIMG